MSASGKADESSRSPVTVIAIAIVEHGDYFLVGTRPPGKPLAGYSEFPGGKVEPGESVAAATARECVEEAGLTIVAGRELLSCRHDYPHGMVELHFVACTLADQASAPLGAYRWVRREELLQLTFPPANSTILRMLTAPLA